MEERKHAGHQAEHGKENHYRHLAIMTVLSFIAMYVLMYAMVDRFTNVYNNLNQAYMAGLMAAPMVLIELGVMRGMYHNSKWNVAIVAAAVVATALCFTLVRRQAAIGDRQFLRSMIPHHASAILMCKQASVRAPEIVQLCNRPNGILESQQREIEQMRALLGAAGR